MRNGNTTEEEEEEQEEQEQEEEIASWEIARAFAEDAIRSTTWPPRSYTCSFCRREFRSAQALGGHMNVHRRDRAQLHQAQTQAQAQNLGTGLISAPAEDSFLMNCYSWGHGTTSGGVGTTGMFPYYNNYSGIHDYSEGNFSPFRSDYFLPACRNINDSNEIPHTTEMSNNGCKDNAKGINNEEEETISEELDLELRLGIYIPAR